MPKPNLQNRTNFKSYLRYFKNKFNSVLQKIPHFYIKDILSYESAGISTTTEVNVVIFDNNDTVAITTAVNNNELIYVPALSGDSINLLIGDNTHLLKFIDEDGGIQYNNITYGLGDSISVGNKNLIIKGLGGGLLQPSDPPVYSLGISTTTVNEGGSVNFTINTLNVGAGATLYYSTSGTVSSADFSNNSLTGSFSIIGTGATTGVATVTRTIANDFLTESSETFSFVLRTNSTSGTVVATSSTITVVDLVPSYSVTPSTNSVNEGGSVNFTINTVNVGSGATLYYSTGGSMEAADFSNNSLTGSFSIIGTGATTGVATVTRTIANDVNTEGNETFTFVVRTTSSSGTVVATSSTITVLDVVPEYSVTPSTNSVNEGSSVVFTVTTVGIANATVLYWTTLSTLGAILSSDFNDAAVSGSFTVNSNTGTITRTLASDRFTDGLEKFKLQIRTASTSGTIVATSNEVTINDTSVNIGQNANGLTFGPVQVNRDAGVVANASDWYAICGIDNLPEGSKIAMFIDNSGSMTTATIQASYNLLVSKLSAKNITIITVENGNEDWITPFLTDLS